MKVWLYVILFATCSLQAAIGPSPAALACMQDTCPIVSVDGSSWGYEADCAQLCRQYNPWNVEF